MTDQEAAEIVAAGSLSARIIRKCPTHRDCPLTCKQRRVEDLGEIANFTSTPERSWREKFVGWMHAFSGGNP